MEDPRGKQTMQRESPGRAGPEGLDERTAPTCRPAFARSKPPSDGSDRRPEPVEGKNVGLRRVAGDPSLRQSGVKAEDESRPSAQPGH